MSNSGIDQLTISFPLSDTLGHRTQSYNTMEATNSGVWASKIALKNYMNCHSEHDVGVKFGTESKVEDESRISSPPLWTTSQPSSPQHYRSLSPSSKTQAIERGQRELMEMVQNMPESCYELSLKDLVEHSRVDIREEHRAGEKNLSNKILQKRAGQGCNGRKVDKKGEVGKRSENIDSGGLYLKMMFPTSLGYKKNKKKNEINNSSMVSLRPSVSDRLSDSSIISGSMKSSCCRSKGRHEMSAGCCWPFSRRSESLAQN